MFIHSTAGVYKDISKRDWREIKIKYMRVVFLFMWEKKAQIYLKNIGKCINVLTMVLLQVKMGEEDGLGHLCPGLSPGSVTGDHSYKVWKTIWNQT